jgi:hypothetical protein
MPKPKEERTIKKVALINTKITKLGAEISIMIKEMSTKEAEADKKAQINTECTKKTDMKMIVIETIQVRERDHFLQGNIDLLTLLKIGEEIDKEGFLTKESLSKIIMVIRDQKKISRGEINIMKMFKSIAKVLKSLTSLDHKAVRLKNREMLRKSKE